MNNDAVPVHVQRVQNDPQRKQLQAEIEEQKKPLLAFCRRRIIALTKETAAYMGIEAMLMKENELTPEAAKMLLDWAKQDNRFMGRE